MFYDETTARFDYPSVHMHLCFSEQVYKVDTRIPPPDTPA